MKKLMLILAFLPIMCFAQGQTEATHKGLSLGISFSPDFNSCFFNESYEWKGMFDSKPKFGYTTGLNLDWRINNLFSLGIGASFINWGYADELIGKESAEDPGILHRVNNNYYYIGIPINAKIYFINKKPFNFFATVGISPDFYLNRLKQVLRVPDRNTREVFTDYVIDGANRVILNLFGGIGLSYDINSKWFLEAEALFRGSVIPLCKKEKTLTDIYFYSIGLDLSINYRF